LGEGILHESEGNQKKLFLKTIQKHLFSGFGGRYSATITIVVDDNLVKHVLNPCENVILLKSWTFACASESNTYLMDTPWVLQLHVN
jgi:hypothetical protein